MTLAWQKFPGGELIRQGIEDIAGQRTTIPACLIVIASPKLLEAKLLPADTQFPFSEGERTLYRLLRQEEGDAFSKYNALLRLLVSFEHCLARELRSNIA